MSCLISILRTPYGLNILGPYLGTTSLTLFFLEALVGEY